MEFNTKEAAVVIGASSGLGRSLATVLASNGVDIVIAARHEHDLKAIAGDLQFRYKVKVKVVVVDIAKLNVLQGEEFVNRCFQSLGHINQIYVTAGMVSDDDFGPESVTILKQINDVNFAGITYLLAPFCQRLCNSRSNITVISTIATIRPRGRNVAYASAKIALEYFVRGLQHFYADKSMRLQIYRMGYMRTAMSAGKKLALPVADPNKVAAYIFKNRSKRFHIRYYPRFWAMIAIPLKMLPWFMYKNLKH